jgi:tripartite-type tricarboxylate transporter receptor subunit TctC
MGLSISVLAFLAISLLGIVYAAEFPDKPVTMINPVGPGGSHDLTARALTSVAATYLGQPIIVHLRPGGGGAIGTEQVAKAAPDGYTILFGGPGWNSTLPAIEGRSKGPDALDAVCRINYSPLFIMTRTELPFKSLKDVIDYAKAEPGKLTYGNTGPWGAADLPWKQIRFLTRIETRDIPYSGGGEHVLSLLGGHLQVIGAMKAQTMPHVKSGKLRLLAVLDNNRDRDFPDVPTAKEQGIDVTCLMWRGILVPKGTPRPTIDKLHMAFSKMAEDKTLVEMIKRFGDEIQYLGPDEFTKAWREEYELHKKLGQNFKK